MRKIILLSLMPLLLFACKREISNQSLAEAEDNLRQLSANEDSTRLRKAQKALIADYLAYAQEHSNAIETPDYLFKAAGLTEVAEKNTSATLKILEQIPQKYPDSERSAQALYRLAIIYQDKKKDTVVAKQYYLELIEKYPNHPLTISLQQ